MAVDWSYMKRVLLIILACSIPAAMLLGYWYRPGGELQEIDEWEVATMQGKRIGSNHTTVTHTIEDGRSLVKAAQSMQMVIKRSGQDTRMVVDCRDTETPDGRLLDFEATIGLGDAPIRTTGKVVGDRMELQIESQGKTVRQTLDWPRNAGGFLAPVLSLRAAPLKPGERRTLKHLNFDGQVYVTEFAAEKEEFVDLWRGTSQLLKVEMVEHVDLNPRDTSQDLKSAIWINSSGDVLKSTQCNWARHTTASRAMWRSPRLRLPST